MAVLSLIRISGSVKDSMRNHSLYFVLLTSCTLSHLISEISKRGSMQMSMRKLDSHTILQNYPLLCCCHVTYKLLYHSIRVRTALSSLSVRVRVRVSFMV